jgi:hypothetical protein
MDLVGTCPKDFWREWIAEGDPAGVPWSGEEWGWYTRHSLAAEIKQGERFYVVAWGRLRGWAPVTRVARDAGGGWIICREGHAVSCTLEEPVPGFRGLEKRWWRYEDERPFDDWQDANVGKDAKRKAAIALPLPLFKEAG